MTAFAFYLLKVMICSGVLFLYYYLALRNKLFHQWNRFYLLAAIVISLIAPVVQVTIMHSADQPDKAIQVLQVFESAGGYLEEVTISGRPSISTDQWLLMGYILISGVFLLTFLLSFQKIISIVKSHTIQWIEKIGFISTKVQGTPFSFFNYIFWNEDIDLQTETGKQIFQHELVHVKEKHTIDKLFVQLVLMVFWCNPFFWLIRRELKLIHEFIADKRSVGQHGTAALAAMILNASYPTRFNSLTNQFFQTSIKRRIAMLAKIQNPRINYLSRILAFSILIVTVLAFTLHTKKLTVPSVKLDKTITVVIDAGHGVMENGKHNGAVVDNVAEDDIVLAIANKIKELNTNDQIKIVLTRPTKQVTDLRKRVDIARENSADLFLSLHVNAEVGDAARSGKGLKSGFDVYVSNKETTFQKQSETLGSVLSEELNSVYPTNTFLSKKQVGIWVLDQNVCPSVMIDCGWLTSKKDRDFITKEKNQEEVARKILDAIGRYALNSQTRQDDLIVLNLLDTVPKNQVTIKEVILPAPTTPNQDNGIQFRSKLDSANPPLIIFDGKELSKDDLAKINADEIMSMTVLKGQTATGLYGEKAKNGAIIITSKNNNAEVKEVTVSPIDTVPQKNNQNKVKEIFIDGQKLRPDEVRFSKISLEQWAQVKNSKQPIVVDDKLVQSIDNIDPSEIVSISRGIGHPLVKEYGDKAATGVIFITTKNYKRTGSEPIFTKVEIEASVNREQWTKHLQSQLKSFIENAASKGMGPGNYTVQVRFLVLKDGSVTDVRALSDPGYGLADAAVKTVQTGPKWNPGLQNNKPVNSYHTQPITFVIQEQGNDEPKKVSPEVTLSELKKMDRLNINNLISFDLVYLSDDGIRAARHKNLTASFDETSKTILAKQQPGDIISFESILVNENGKEVKKPAFFYKVR